MPSGYNAGSVYVEAELNTDKFKAATADFASDNNKIVSALGEMASGVKDAQSAYDAYASKVKAAETELVNFASALSSALDEGEANLGKIEDAKGTLAGLAETIAQLKSQYAEGGSQDSSILDSLKTYEDEYKNLQDTLSSLETAQAQYDANVDSTYTAMNNAELTLEKYRQSLEGSKAALESLNGAAEQLEPALDQGETISQMDALSEKISSIKAELAELEAERAEVAKFLNDNDVVAIYNDDYAENPYFDELEKYAELNQRIADARAEIEQLIASNQSAFQTAATDVGVYESQLSQAETKVESFSQTVSDLNAKLVAETSANVNPVVYQPVVDMSKYQAGVQQVDAATSKLEAALNKVNAGIQKAENDLKILALSLEESRAKMESAQSAYKSAATELETLKEQAEAATIKAADLGKAYEAAAAKFGEMSAQAFMIKRDYDEAANFADALNAVVEKQEQKVAKSEAAFKAAEASVAKYESRITETQSRLESFTQTASELNSKLQEGNTTAAVQELSTAITDTAGSSDTLNSVISKLTPILQRGFGSALQSSTKNLAIFKNSSGLSSIALTTLQRSIRPFISSLSACNLAFMGVGAAALYGAYKFYDFKSGAAAARESLESLTESAEEWNSTNIKTSFEESDGLSGLGVDESGFKATRKTQENWVEGLVEVWTDGKGETDEIVQQWVDSFSEGSDEMKTSLETLKTSAETAGVGDVGIFGDIDADIARIDEIDGEVESLLKKRQNGYLTDDEIAQLQSLYDEKEAIEIKYKLTEENDGTSGFEEIQQSVAAAMSRGADGETVWADGYTAANQGLQTYIDSLNEEYDAQYKTIQLMEDGAEKTQALEQLQQWYNDKVTEGQEAYGKTMDYINQTTGDMFTGEGKYADSVTQLNAAMEAMYAAAQDPSNANMQAFYDSLQGLDETSIVEMTSALTAMQAAGVELTPEMQSALEAITALKSGLETDVFKDNTDLFTALSNMFGENLDSEVLEINASMNTEALDNVYNAWAAGEHADIIPTIDTQNIELSELENLQGKVTGIYQGENVSIDLNTLDTLNGTVTVINDAGESTTVKLTELEGLQGTVTGYHEGKSIRFTADNLNSLDGIVSNVYVSPTAEKETVQLEGEVTSVKVNFEEGEFSNSANSELEFKQAEGKTDSGLGKGFSGSEIDGDFVNAVNQYVASTEQLETAQEKLAGIDMVSDIQGYMTASDEVTAANSAVTSAGNAILSFAEDGENFDTAVQYVVNGLQQLSEGNLTEDEATALLTFINNLMFAMNSLGESDIGNAFMSNIAAGMAEYGWDADATNIMSMIAQAVSTAAQDQMPEVGVSMNDGTASGMEDTSSVEAAAKAVGDAGFDAEAGSVGMGSPATRFMPIGNSMVTGTAVGMEDVSPVTAAATNIGTAAETTLSSTISSSSLSTVGSNFSSGLAQGILDGKSGVINAAIQVASAAATAAKEALQINSPSKLTEGFGEYFDAGFIRGIENMTPDVQKAVSDVLQVSPPRSSYGSEMVTATQQRSGNGIDYERLGDAMRERPLYMTYDGRTIARIGANDTARAQNNRARRIAVGYGK